MLFNSFEFLAFLVLVLAVYWAIPRTEWRNLFLTLASYLFYGAWYPPYVLLLLFTTGFDYVVARRLAALESNARRRLLVACSLLVNLGLLAFFKYSNFFVLNLNQALALFGASPIDWTLKEVAVPIGLSFYTFQSISYVIDVYRRQVLPVERLRDYLLFVSFFPQLEAGPIIRAPVLIPQLGRRKFLTWNRAHHATHYLALGFFQKVVMADNMAPLVNLVFTSPASLTAADKWLGVYGFAFQIYFDFAGYSNIAIGLGGLLGFRVPHNFRNPYIAQGFQEFWRRWHISLSTWLRDYLYKPLGGNRSGTLATYRNLLLTMLLGGLWHGANWTFVVWGLLHGCYLVAERMAGRLSGPRAAPAPAAPLVRLARIVVTFHLICLAWVFFRTGSMQSSLDMLQSMLAGGSFALSEAVRPHAAFVALAMAGLCVAWIMASFGRRLRLNALTRSLADGAMVASLLIMPGDRNAFIYFQF